MNAIITGATKGIGRAIAERMATRSYNLCLCSRSVEDLEKAKEHLLSINPDIQVYVKATDMSNRNQVRAFSDFVRRSFSNQINILVNNAGLFIPGLISEEEEGALEKMIETNLYSAYYLTRDLLDALKDTKPAYIVNMASVASLLAYPNGGSYSISKFALRGFSMVLRDELKETGVKVTTVMPGATWSDSWKGVDLPESRLMQAGDIAKAVMSIFDMSPAAVVEEMVIRPQLGDL